MNMNANDPNILLNGQMQEQYMFVNVWRRPICLTHVLFGALLVHPDAHTLSTILLDDFLL